MAESFINNLNYDLPAPQRKPRVQKYTGGSNSRAVIEAESLLHHDGVRNGQERGQVNIEKTD